MLKSLLDDNASSCKKTVGVMILQSEEWGGGRGEPQKEKIIVFLQNLLYLVLPEGRQKQNTSAVYEAKLKLVHLGRNGLKN